MLLRIKLFLLLLMMPVVFVHQLNAEGKPAPDSSNSRYGNSEMNTYDFWRANSSRQSPLVIYIHGGGFSSGSKARLSASMLNALLEQGISVMAIDYRLTPEVTFPTHYLDCARAIQFARYHAAELNIDPSKIGLTGSSAGGCVSLWLAFHDNLADSTNEDPVLRMSTRVSCAAVFSAQSTLDIRLGKEWFGEIIEKFSFFKGDFFGLTPSKMNTPEAFRLFEDASPVTHLTKDDPAVLAYYSIVNTPATPGEAIHHVKFGEYLKQKMDELGLECHLLRKDEDKSVNKQCAEFFRQHFINPLK